MIKYLRTHFLECIIISLWGLYWMLVLIREARGAVFLPVHDGFLGVIATILTGIYLIFTPKSSQQPSQQPFPIWMIIIIIQALLLTQLYQAGTVGATLLFRGIVSLMIIVSTLVFYEVFLRYILPQKYNAHIKPYLDISPVSLQWVAIIGFGIFGFIPWGVFLLAQLNVPLVIGFVMSVLIVSILLLVSTRKKRDTVPQSSLSDIISKKYTQNIFRLGFFIVCLVLGGVGYWTLQQWGEGSSQMTQDIPPIRMNLIDLSRNWSVRPDQYGLNISSGDPEQLEFAVTIPASGKASISTRAVIKQEAGQIQADLFRDGERVQSQKLPSFRCQEWFKDSSFEGRIRKYCQPLTETIELFEFEADENEEYILIIKTIPYKGPIFFTPDGQLRQGEILIEPPYLALTPST